MLFSFFLFALGLVFLIAGAHFLVDGAICLAKILKISPLLIGLTVVSLGTSAPEIAFSTISALQGQSDLVMGNILGSNIVNILLILGIAATISSIRISKKLIIVDVPILIGLTLLYWFFGWLGTIGRVLGILLCALLVLYIVFAYWLEKNGQQKKETPASKKRWQIQLLLFIVGAFFLAMGSEWLIKSSLNIASLFGVSPLFISLTLVSISTSLPELVTSIMAIIKKQKELAVGNIIGSNIFNLLAVGGFAALVAPEPIVISKNAMQFDIPVMIATSVACLPIFLSGHIISRFEGILFLCYYLFYLAYLIVTSINILTLPLFQSALWLFIIPLTLFALIVILYRRIRNKV